MKPTKVSGLFGRNIADRDGGSENGRGDDGEADAAIEDRLRSAFEHHANGIEPSPDAYAMLARSVAERSRNRDRMATIRPFLVAAAAVAALAGGGLVLNTIGTDAPELEFAGPSDNDPDTVPGNGSGDGSDGDSDGDSHGDSDGTAEDRSPAPEGSDDAAAAAGDPEALNGPAGTVVDDDGGPTAAGGSDASPDPFDSLILPTVGVDESAMTTRPLDGAGFGSNALLTGDATRGLWVNETQVGAAAAGTGPVDAARALLRLIDRTDLTVTAGVSPGLVTIGSGGGADGLRAGSDPKDGPTMALTVHRYEDGTHVVAGGARTGTSVGVTTVDGSGIEPAVDDGPMIGSFEVVVDTLDDAGIDGVQIELHATTDVRTLFTAFTEAERDDGRIRASLEVPAVGVERAWVVVYAVPVDGSPLTVPLSVTPIAYRGAVDPGPYTVVGLEVDDPNGGLLIHSGPGTADESVGLVPMGASSVRRLATEPVHVAGDTWWHVIAPEGTTGWVSSRHLASVRSVSETDRIEVATAMADALRNGTGLDVGELPLSNRLSIRTAALGPVSPPTDPLSASADAERVVSDELLTRSETVALDAIADLAAGVGTVEPTLEVKRLSGAQAEVVASWFGDLPSVALRSTAKPDQQLIVSLEATPTGPQIVGVVAVSG